MIIRAMLVGATVLLSGCAKPTMPTIGVERLDDIPAVRISEIDAIREIDAEILGKISHETLAEVAGVSCKRAYGASASSWEDAVRRTKYKAMQQGANAIANLTCGLPERISLSTMCLEAIRCTASAIRVTK